MRNDLIDRAKEVRKRLRESSRIAKMGEIAGESGAGTLSKQLMEAADTIKLLLDELEGRFFQGELPDGAVITDNQLSGDMAKLQRIFAANRIFEDGRYPVSFDWPTEEEWSDPNFDGRVVVKKTVIPEGMGDMQGLIYKRHFPRPGIYHNCKFVTDDNETLNQPAMHGRTIVGAVFIDRYSSRFMTQEEYDTRKRRE